jgi:hypothetical protein
MVHMVHMTILRPFSATFAWTYMRVNCSGIISTLLLDEWTSAWWNLSCNGSIFWIYNGYKSTFLYGAYGRFEAFLSDFCMDIYESRLIRDHFHVIMGGCNIHMMKSELQRLYVLNLQRLKIDISQWCIWCIWPFWGLSERLLYGHIWE